MRDYFKDHPTSSSIFAGRKDLVAKWLKEAQEECSKLSGADERAYYGGPYFILQDTSTYWTETNQLVQWWKNHVERKTKFKNMQDDALYEGLDYKKIQR